MLQGYNRRARLQSGGDRRRQAGAAVRGRQRPSSAGGAARGTTSVSRSRSREGTGTSQGAEGRWAQASSTSRTHQARRERAQITLRRCWSVAQSTGGLARPPPFVWFVAGLPRRPRQARVASDGE